MLARIIMIGSAVGERVQVPGLVPYSAKNGAVKKMFSQGLSNRGWRSERLNARLNASWIDQGG